MSFLGRNYGQRPYCEQKKQAEEEALRTAEKEEGGNDGSNKQRKNDVCS